MNIFEAIILGIVQGATEFLPVSSSGHLAIFSNLFGINTGAGVLFEVLLHLGTLIAVCLVFRKDFKNLVYHGIGLIIDVLKNIIIFFRNKFGRADIKYNRIIKNAYRKFAALIIITCIPTAILAFLIEKVVVNASSTLLIPGICLIITAILLIFMDGREGGSKKVKDTTYKDAGLIGIAQGVATLPGISRSGATIATGLLLGQDKAFAIKYSFLGSIPAIVGANILELRHIGSDTINGGFLASCLAGMIVAGVVGYFCIKFMINIVKKSRYQNFGYYCAAVGVISVIIYLVAGK